MYKNYYSTALLLSFMVFITSCAITSPTLVSELEDTDQVMMVVIDDPRSERRKLGISGPGYSARFAYDDDPLLHQAAMLVADDHGLTILAEWPLRNLDVHCFAIAQPSDDTLTALENDARVRWVQPFNRFTVEISGAAHLAANEAPIHQFFNNFSERGNNVKVAVIDTSADTSHPDLAQSRITEMNFAGNRGLSIKEAHGTAVVGLIASKPASPEGIAGLANNADVRLLRGCWEDGSGKGTCNTLTLALALDAAIDLRPAILNLSLTGPYDEVLNQLLTVLLNQNTLIVAAYDENRAAGERFPLPQTGVVYAYGIDGERTLAAPENVLYAPRHAISLAPNAGYELVSGHSIAAPHVTAMAACLIDHNPNADRQQIVSSLQEWLSGSQRDPTAPVFGGNQQRFSQRQTPF